MANDPPSKTGGREAHVVRHLLVGCGAPQSQGRAATMRTACGSGIRHCLVDAAALLHPPMLPPNAGADFGVGSEKHLLGLVVEIGAFDDPSNLLVCWGAHAKPE